MKLIVGKNNDEVLIDDADYEAIRDFNLCVGGKDKYVKLSRQRNRELESHSLHRFLLNPPKDMVVDHIDGNRLNNHRSNLRILTRSENAINKGLHKSSTTGITGVSWAPSHQRFLASISVNRKRIPLGRFKTVEAATEARRKAEVKYHGEFSRRAPQQVELPLEDSDLFFGPEVVQASLFGGEDD